MLIFLRCKLPALDYAPSGVHSLPGVRKPEFLFIILSHGKTEGQRKWQGIGTMVLYYRFVSNYIFIPSNSK